VTQVEVSESEASARGRSVAIVAARFNEFIVSSLLKGARACWAQRDRSMDTSRRGSALTVVRTPGHSSAHWPRASWPPPAASMPSWPWAA
jgi:6,7-dimethyl-8-ribityllumazine synthase